MTLEPLLTLEPLQIHAGTNAGAPPPWPRRHGPCHPVCASYPEYSRANSYPWSPFPPEAGPSTTRSSHCPPWAYREAGIWPWLAHCVSHAPNLPAGVPALAVWRGHSRWLLCAARVAVVPAGTPSGAETLSERHNCATHTLAPLGALSDSYPCATHTRVQLTPLHP